MKIKPLLLTLFAFAFLTVSFAQNVFKEYQDGIVVFQLKEDQDLILSQQRKVDFKTHKMFSSYLKEYKIEEVMQLLPDIESENLKRVYQIKLKTAAEMEQVLHKLRKNENVKYAEYKEVHKVSAAAPSDPYYQYQYWLPKIQAEQAWNISQGSSNIIVAVVDDAMNTDHPDLKNIFVNPYDAYRGINDARGLPGNGDHGSHCSGIIGGQTGNGVGIASIGNGISVMPIAAGNEQGLIAGGYEGIAYAADHGASVISCSWGGGGYSQYGQDVIDYAWNKGAIVVAAAGNGNSNYTIYPAGYNHVVAVASTDEYDNRSGFSNYGNWVDISAPGTNIFSTYYTGYNYMSGTSMATPVISGVLGLMKSHKQNASQNELLNCLYQGADAMSNSYYQNGWMGAGRVNAFKSLQCLGEGNTNPNPPSQSNDVELVSIAYPTGQINENTFEPQVKVRNNGNTNLTYFTIKYEAGGQVVEDYVEGNIVPGATGTTYGTEKMTLPDGDYTLTITVDLPNHQQDDNPADNTQSISLRVGQGGGGGFDPNPNPDPNPDPNPNPGSGVVTLYIDTDCWGNETTWKIFNQNNQVVESGGPYTSNYYYGNSYHHTLNLPAGCYTFTIYDADGDGMNGSQYSYCYDNGYYEMVDENGTQLFEMDTPNFGRFASHQFCIDGQSADGNNPPSNIDAGIAQINTPNGSIYGSYMYPEVVLKNFGSTILTSVNIEYNTTIDHYTHKWTGNLQPGKTTKVSLPYIYVGNGSQVFKARTANPNNQTDANPSNDEAQKSFTVYLSAYKAGDVNLNDIRLNIFPNPTEGIVNLDWTGNTIESVEVYDLLGRKIKVLKQPKEDEYRVMDLSELQNGVYFIKVTSDSRVFTKKIIKK